MFRLKARARTIALAVIFACALGSNASATPLTLATDGVVGTLDGKLGDSNPTTELAIAQQLLDYVGLGVVAPTACVTCYRTSTVFDYEATLSNPQQSMGGLRVVPAAYDYVLAKYDGPNAGYVLFYLPKFGSHTLPQYPADLWTTNPTKWALSHFTTFDAEVEIVEVPDGGSTAALLGVVLCGIGFISRRFARH